MVKIPHEALHRIFRKDTDLFARVFPAAFGIDFPKPRRISVVDNDLTEIEPIERRVDTVLLVEMEDDRRHLLLFESQTRPDEAKRRSWPYYVSYLHNKYECPVTLLVLTADTKTAKWAEEPIQIGLVEMPTLVARPLVLGPHNVYGIFNSAIAQQDVMLTVLSALTHRHDDNVGVILNVLAAALDEVDEETAKYLAEFTEGGLGETDAADIWRALMTTMAFKYQSKLRQQWNDEGRQEGLQQGIEVGLEQGLEQGLEKGRLEGEALAVLRVLTVRGIAVPKAIERAVFACTDEALLQTLLTRAVTVERAEELFA